MWCSKVLALCLILLIGGLDTVAASGESESGLDESAALLFEKLDEHDSIVVALTVYRPMSTEGFYLALFDAFLFDLPEGGPQWAEEKFDEWWAEEGFSRFFVLRTLRGDVRGSFNVPFDMNVEIDKSYVMFMRQTRDGPIPSWAHVYPAEKFGSRTLSEGSDDDVINFVVREGITHLLE
ncbi:MAG: hypothetical protein JJT88_16745 [Gammaproteobacteria bacterium]|nr:hypothetical protein [Gammaproteobacteria bacterium]